MTAAEKRGYREWLIIAGMVVALIGWGITDPHSNYYPWVVGLVLLAFTLWEWRNSRVPESSSVHIPCPGEPGSRARVLAITQDEGFSRTERRYILRSYMRSLGFRQRQALFRDVIALNPYAWSALTGFGIMAVILSTLINDDQHGVRVIVIATLVMGVVSAMGQYMLLSRRRRRLLESLRTIGEQGTSG